MTLDTIVKARIEQYKKDYYLTTEDDDVVFERFVIDNILSQFQPDVFKTDHELLDQICIGGGEDMGIDGIAISLDGQFIKSREEIDEILEARGKVCFEFYFIQAKNKRKFDSGEYLKFSSGIESFLKDTVDQPHGKKIDEWHDIFNYIMSDETIVKWLKRPGIKWFYVVNGVKEDIHHIESFAGSTKKDLMEGNAYDTVEYFLIGSKELLEIIDVNENNYETVIDMVDSMSLPSVSGVDNSSVVLCSADELIKLITTPDGLLRKNIFEDNVRDYQGSTTINQEISDTVKNQSERFVLLNNGITVVCDKIEGVNRKIKITNPRVVNGCQTCSVLFQSYKNNIDLSDVNVVVKFIGSADDDIVNSIVRGTNRQNIVYEEAFEITRDFHKRLEDFFRSFSIDGREKIYYERRSKQYDSPSSISLFQKVNFRILIQSFVSLFLYKPEDGNIHESKLLRSYNNSIFLDNQSFYPYYVSAYIYLFCEKLFRTKNLQGEFYSYKFYIMMIFKELVCGESPDINNSKKIDKYCKNLLQYFSDEEKCRADMNKAVQLFSSISDDWVNEKGLMFKAARKSNAKFTKFVLKKIRNHDYVDRIIKNGGRVLSTGVDINGQYYGFIERKPENIFFHQRDNPQMTLDYKGKWVFYDLYKTDKGERAVHVTLQDNDE